MFMRLVQVKVKPEKSGEFRDLYNDKILPALQETPGCLYAALIVNEPRHDECISMTLWDSLEHVVAYSGSERFRNLLAESRPYLSDSSEWKVQLSQDLTLEYSPVPEEPVITSYNVSTPLDEQISLDQDSLCVRLVSIKTHPDRRDEFVKLYRNDILPALHEIPGCRYAYLNENMQAENEFISVTVWNSKEDADRYEQSGLFDQLISKIKHTFTGLFQWKMELDKGRQQAVTSDDLKVQGYTLVTGKTFR